MARFLGVGGFDEVRSHNGLNATAAQNFDQGLSFADQGLASMARMRAADYLANAQVSAAQTDANSSILGGAISGLTGLASGAFRGLAQRPTLGSGQPSAPAIDPSNATAGERALMGAQYKLY